MNKQELLERIVDLYNYVRSVRNDLSQLDGAIARLKIDTEMNFAPQNTMELAATDSQQPQAKTGEVGCGK